MASRPLPEGRGDLRGCSPQRTSRRCGHDRQDHVHARRTRGRGGGWRDHLAGGAEERHQYPAPVLASGTRLPGRRQLPRLHGRGRRRARLGRLLPEEARRRHEGEVGERAGEEIAPRWCSSCCWPTSRSGRRATIRASKFWSWVDAISITPTSRFPRDHRPAADVTHSAIAVNLDACINCGLCVRACREVQANDVIGMAFRGHGAKVVFDFDQAWGSRRASPAASACRYVPQAH